MISDPFFQCGPLFQLDENAKYTKELDPIFVQMRDSEGIRTLVKRRFDGIPILVQEDQIFQGKYIPLDQVNLEQHRPISADGLTCAVYERIHKEWGGHPVLVAFMNWFQFSGETELEDGHYWAVGPSFNSHDQLLTDQIITYGMHSVEGVEPTYEGLRQALEERDLFGVDFVCVSPLGILGRYTACREGFGMGPTELPAIPVPDKSEFLN